MKTRVGYLFVWALEITPSAACVLHWSLFHKKDENGAVDDN